MPIELHVNPGPPVAAKTYTPFWPPFARNKPQVTEELYISDEDDTFIGSHLRKTPKKDGTVEERVISQGLLRIIDRDEYLRLVDASAYARLEKMYQIMTQGLDQRTKGFLHENPDIAQRNMKEAIDEIVKRVETEQPDFTNSVADTAKKFAEYVQAHEKFMIMVFGLGKKQMQVVGGFDQEAYDGFIKVMRAYFLSTQKMYFRQ